MTETVGRKINIKGVVQGVGFRPFVYTQAVQNNLTGWVRNTSRGVEIEINGSAQAVQVFVNALRNNPPSLSRIDKLTETPCLPDGYAKFEIVASKPKPGDFIPISPDVALCEDCINELFDSSDRRFRYPFINCTNCGPRFTIIKDTPYDRPQTTMAGFTMCPDCQREYEDPLNRRFHAQPTACPACGPQIWFEADGRILNQREDALQTARTWLQEGKILAIKGLGGYHLACDASNHEAVAELRNRKKRSDKPFALMAFDVESVQRHCQATEEDRQLLTSRQHPIVLLERLPESPIVEAVAPAQKTLGFMLPYTPLHLLLLEPAPGFPDALVMTSGNMSEEPIAYTDEDAAQRLSPIADGFLMHDRPIHMRVDDSVARVFKTGPQLLRRARGYAPDTTQLPHPVPPILATGAELKNTFCLSREQYAFLSHHIGDLENYETLVSFESGINHYENLFRVSPQMIAVDLHPNYLSTRYGRQRSGENNLPLVSIQHHHAHLAACLADNGWNSTDPVIGLIFDGTGYGTDGAIWGSEVLFGGYENFQRKYHLAYTPLPGGDLSIRKPARMALAHLWQAELEWEANLAPIQALCAQERSLLRAQLENNINTPLTSSMGRLFDAAAALAGVRQEVNYEGQAAIEFEMIADTRENGAYPFSIEENQISSLPLWRAMLTDIQQAIPPTIISARFHNGIAALNHQLCL
ncbi:MAG: carbamoyltransferase HypF, partial [Anaerolineaceae bacterium]|nr:carbamoyltransferase HypF [Anaerolineaceae bacterium]